MRFGIKFLACIFAICFLLAMTAAAEASGGTDAGWSSSTASAAGSQDSSSVIQEQMRQSGAAGLSDSLPSQAKKGLGAMGIDGPDTASLAKFTPANLLKAAGGSLRDAAARPLKSVAAVLGILLACALLATLKNSLGEKPLKPVFDTVCALCIAAAVLTPIAQCLLQCADTIRQAGTFSLSFLPVFTALATASGHPASAAVFQGMMLTVSQGMIAVAAGTFVPMVSIYLAFCVVGSVAPGVRIQSLASFIKKAAVWGLTLCVTVFVGILTVQSLITGAADTVTVKTAKFMVGSFVPVVGGAISDALNTVVSCANLVKTATGAYAIIAFLLAFLPSVLECLFWMLALDLSAAGAEILGVNGMTGLLKATKDAVSIMLAVVVTCALALIVSTAVMLTLGAAG